MTAPKIRINASARDAGFGIGINLAWQARGETAEQIAERLLASERAFEAITPAASRWIDPRSGALVPSDLEATRQYVRESTYTDETRRVLPALGFIVRLYRSIDDESLASPGIEAWVGNSRSRNLPNTVRITLSGGANRAEEFNSKGADVLQALVEIWQPDVAIAGTTDQGRATFIRGTKLPRLGAVSWFGSEFAIPEEVPLAVVSPFADGTLVVIGSADAASTDPALTARVHRYLVDRGYLHEPLPRAAPEPVAPEPGLPTHAGPMTTDAEMLFSFDVAEEDAEREAQRLAEWLVASGWMLPSLAPGPRAFATGAVDEKQGGPVVIVAGPRLNMQGVDMEGPLCPYCETQVDFERLIADIDDEPYPVVQCLGCGKDVAYADWIGTAHPIMSNLTIGLDRWMISDSPSSPPLLAEIREAMGGRWVHMWQHW